MASAAEVLEMLIPDGGWISTGNEYEGIQFLECEPITKEQFQAGLATYDVWKTKKEASKAAAREAVLTKLGLTAEEVAALLS